MDSSRHRLACIGVVVAAAVAFVALRAPLLSLPLERDEGEYAYIAQRMAHGEVPYRDAFDQKPPGVFLAYRAAFALFGESIEAIHLFLYLWTAATGWVLFTFVRRIADPTSAAFALLVFAVTSMDPRILAQAANTELFLLLPLVGSLACVARALSRPTLAWWFASGALAMCACWFKQVAVVQGAVAGGAALFAVAAPGSSRSRNILAVAAGAGAAALPVLVGFAWVGAFEPFLDAVLLHNLDYASQIPWQSGVAVLGARLWEQAPSFAIVWASAAIALVAPRRVWPAAAPPWGWPLLTAVLVTSAIGVSAGFYFRPHYFVQLLPAWAALSGITLGYFARWLLNRSAPIAAAGLATASLALVVPAVASNRDVLFADSPAEASRQIYGLNPFPESIEIARYIRAHSGDGDEIYIIGSEPQILFYADRRSATRYIFFYPLTGPYPEASRRQREAIAEVAARRPLYVVWVNVGTSLSLRSDTDKEIFQSGSRWLRRKYRLETVAIWDSDRAQYDFSRGETARARLDEADEDMGGQAWVAVFRRAR